MDLIDYPAKHVSVAVDEYFITTIEIFTNVLYK